RFSIAFLFLDSVGGGGAAARARAWWCAVVFRMRGGAATEAAARRDRGTREPRRPRRAPSSAGIPQHRARHAVLRRQVARRTRPRAPAPVPARGFGSTPAEAAAGTAWRVIPRRRRGPRLIAAAQPPSRWR